MSTKAQRTQSAINRTKAMAHPLRSTLLRNLSERTASPAELSRELFEDVSTVSYHMRKLVEFECAELVDSRPVRGAVEHFYRATERHLVTAEDWTDLPDGVKAHLLNEFMQPSIDDFERGLISGTLGEDADWYVTRTRYSLDAQGLEDALALHKALIDGMGEIREASANRVAKSGEETINVSSTVNCFRLP